ncbi:MAG: hypothetical protein JXN63_03270 [Candidatus Delongbacteria bacterium]|nr:hypothetical protein [Candidatus Delongbacteria bacterium]
MIRSVSLLIVFFNLSCEKEKIVAERALSDGEQKIADNRIWNMDIDITNAGITKAKVRAGYVEREYLANFKYSVNNIDSGLEIDFYEKGEITGILNSRRGIINDLSEVFTAIDEVIFKSSSGYTLYTDTLIWDRKAAQIHTESDVMMVKDSRDTLYGEGFVSDDRLESYEIRKPKGKALLEDVKLKK